MNTTLVSFSEKEIEKWVSDFVYLLWFKSCSAKTSKYAHPVQIIKKYWQTISAYTCLDRQTFLMLVDFLFETSYFMFNGETYLQIEGTTMGGIASPIFGKFVMNDLVITVVSQLPFPVPFVKFYVDDSVMALPFDMIDETVKIFNSYHDRMPFFNMSDRMFISM